MQTKRTKIVATIGPATESEEQLTRLVKAGLNVMRLNFSHGDFAEHQGKVDNFKKVSKKLGVPLAILQDLGGPKIRIGEFYTERIQLKKGSVFTLTTKKCVGDEHKAYVNYAKLPKEVSKGSRILLDDGKKELRVERLKGTEIICKVIVGGETKGRRGVNVPGANLSISSLTPKDKKDLEFGIKNDVDFIALSFVRRASDVVELKRLLKKRGSRAMVISKIETQEAVDAIDEIIEMSDGIMVARGDLAIEIPAEEVPLTQKMIIEKCNYYGKPVITATQMLESMIHSPVPTRAEVSDVANAILDGTDAIMLSEETTLGDYPVEAVQVMTKVAREIEQVNPERTVANGGNDGSVEIPDSITASAVNTAHEIGAKVIIALSNSGFTARMIARFKPEPPVVAISAKEKTVNQLALSYGCIPEYAKQFKDLKDAFKAVREHCKKHKLAKKGDKVVIVSSAPFNTRESGRTNMLLVETI